MQPPEKSNKASSRDLRSTRQVSVGALGSNKIADVLNAPVMIPGARKDFQQGPKKQLVFNKGDDVMKRYPDAAGEPPARSSNFGE